jgi:hypothetical protein
MNRAKVMAAYEAVKYESDSFVSRKPQRVPAANHDGRPALNALYAHAFELHSAGHNTRGFNWCGETYCVVWLGRRLAVMHSKTRRVLVSAPDMSNQPNLKKIPQ